MDNLPRLIQNSHLPSRSFGRVAIYWFGLKGGSEVYVSEKRTPNEHLTTNSADNEIVTIQKSKMPEIYFEIHENVIIRLPVV